ncbi:MAG: alkaline phosphatase family protein [Acidipila sp.]|nr:alkaline phosphatase family protein [Acidipila sp.]
MNFRSTRACWAAPRCIASQSCRTAILNLLFFVALVAPVASSQTAPPKSGGSSRLPGKTARIVPPGAAPRLVVVLVIDQFRADYLDRFRGSFEPQGFRRLLREGAVFRACFYPYAITETGPGHATLATGTTPDRHGIASNNWYDAEKKRSIYALEDESSPVVGGTPGRTPVSPRNLIGDTLSDELRLANHGRARVFGVALKDRAAILSTGHGASGAYWFDAKVPGFVTSKYYREALPDWVVDFNQKHPLPVPADQFPKTIESSNLTVGFAEALMEKENLGHGGSTDFLFIGLSANDYAGHAWGPYSDEVEKLTIETDHLLATLLNYLDKSVGRGSYWLALSADHGVAPTLAQSRDPGMARLVAKSIDSKTLESAVSAALAARWGAGEWLAKDEELFLNRELLAAKNVRLKDAVHLAGEAALTVPGVAGYVSKWESHASRQITQAYRAGYFPGRSPDLYIVPEPFALFDGEKGGTSHGTPYTYDTQVPLILFGAPFAPGDYYEPASPLDLAPTLAAALRIHPPALSTGRVLAEALRQGFTRVAAMAPPGNEN